MESDEEASEQFEEEEEETYYEEVGQSEEEDYEEEQEEEDESQEEEEMSPSKQGRPQVKLPLKMRAAKLNNPFSNRSSQRQACGRYASRSQQNTPKQTESSSKVTGRGIRKKVSPSISNKTFFKTEQPYHSSESRLITSRCICGITQSSKTT